ncbi:RpiB/LacA/LacB family sugar-phosphate isomerase [Candidatus Hydrogenosomobacter endosymbioticus]|uniref:Ribose 5-phosphate isomerase B n=1 Tax=Candidatus Hydrogenosomobacter endosymbioticus TaxID=2558174 RepID=A0ABN6L2N2_9PROT|nr:RpiB/LacA/LacB family sugar-phosphate isomerase [Candidatus Hydrogenosomobacter endosymbioticus]BDB96098.1 ribose 5-phosphate isomerase B [Candidatus Hydrogenosomobacter endosymbioticus]
MYEQEYLFNKVAIASDHGGFFMKRKIVKFVCSLEPKDAITIAEYGADSDAPCDYPDFIPPVISDVLLDGAAGILICKSGVGMSIGANRFHGIRAALCYNEKVVVSSRNHNDANIMVIPSEYSSAEEVFQWLIKFISAPFHDGRHSRRVQKVELLQTDTKRIIQ